jgi:hypothetical protein
LNRTGRSRPQEERRGFGVEDRFDDGDCGWKGREEGYVIKGRKEEDREEMFVARGSTWSREGRGWESVERELLLHCR